jgi:hypothetical protein
MPVYDVSDLSQINNYMHSHEFGLTLPGRGEVVLDTGKVSRFSVWPEESSDYVFRKMITVVGSNALKAPETIQTRPENLYIFHDFSWVHVRPKTKPDQFGLADIELVPGKTYLLYEGLDVRDIKKLKINHKQI